MSQQNDNDNDNDNDNKSVDPIQTTIVPTTNQNFRKSPSLSVPIQDPVQIKNQLPLLDNSQLLQLYQQLQLHSKSQSPAPAPAAAYKSNSPANNIKSSASVSLGQIQTDNSGNQMVAI